MNDFELSALDYDEDKHFFLAQYFRDQYDEALTNYPFIKSQVQITRLEVWVTNRGQQTLNVRNIVALQDLGEALKEKTRIGLANGEPAGFLILQLLIRNYREIMRMTTTRYLLIMEEC